MNEWSPKGFYSGSADQRHQPRVCRQYWEENWDQGRPGPNSKAMNGYWTREGPNPHVGPYQILNDDLTKGSTSFSVKKKSCASDPRFKRVISIEMRNNKSAESENIQKMEKIPGTLQDQINDEKLFTDKMISYLKSPNESSMYGTLKKFDNLSDDTVTKDVGFNMPMKYADGYDPFRFSNVTYQDSPNFGHSKDCDKIKVNFKTNLKRSASDCTLQTRNNFVDDNEEEGPQSRIRNYPSGTKLGSIHEWMKNNDVSPEKRGSVITVIGQTQTKSLKQILSEINQRRKLAKELDKHALCKAIMESTESRPDVKNLVAKIDFILPNGKVIYSTEKVYLCRDKSKFKIEKECDDYTRKSMEILQVGDQPPTYNEGLKETEQHRKRCEMIPERDSSVTQVGKRSRLKRSTRKSSTAVKEKESLKDISKSFGRKLSIKLFWSVLFLTFLALSAFLVSLVMKPSGFSFISEYFKPKATAWYEKLLYY